MNILVTGGGGFLGSAVCRQLAGLGHEVTAFQRRGNGKFEVKDGTLYPVLYRLEKAGYVEPRWVTQERGVPRKYYQVTARGQEEMNRLVGDWRNFVAAVDSLLEEEDIERD